jgi:hypothetical protein
MNPFHRDQYFMSFDDGTSYWSLPMEYEEKISELAAKLKPKEGDIVHGTTKRRPATPEFYLTPPASPVDVKSSDAVAPPAYSRGSASVVLDEKGDRKVAPKSVKGRFRGSPKNWCKVM